MMMQFSSADTRRTRTHERPPGRVRRLSAMAAVMLLAGACAGDRPRGHGTVEAARTRSEGGATSIPSPTGAEEVPAPFSELAPGSYRVSRFGIPFTFVVGEGWDVLEQSAELIGFARDLPAGMEGEVSLYVVNEVFSPDNPRRQIDVPRDVVSWLSHHPHLEVEQLGPVALDDVFGTRLEVRASKTIAHPRCYTKCMPLFDPEGAPYAVGAEASGAVINALEVGHEWLVYTIYEERKGFEQKAEELLRSIRFVGSP